MVMVSLIVVKSKRYMYQTYQMDEIETDDEMDIDEKMKHIDGFLAVQ